MFIGECTRKDTSTRTQAQIPLQSHKREVGSLEHRYGMADVLGQDCLELGTVGGVRVSVREALRDHGHVADGCGWVVENVGPLFDTLEELLDGKSGINGSVPDLHLRAISGEARVAGTNLVTLKHRSVS
jgi:hypothetical protein